MEFGSGGRSSVDRYDLNYTQEVGCCQAHDSGKRGLVIGGRRVSERQPIQPIYRGARCGQVTEYEHSI